VFLNVQGLQKIKTKQNIEQQREAHQFSLISSISHLWCEYNAVLQTAKEKTQAATTSDSVYVSIEIVNIQGRAWEFFKGG